ncbi:MAG: alpha-glucuronidase family glycosyl hydrolase [Actinomycetota bacterium]
MLTAGASRAAPPPRVEVVVPPAASKLERFAASELSTQFKTLFGAEVRTVPLGKPVTPGVPVILLGSAAGNAAVREAVGAAWPKLSDQGHVVKSVRWRGKPALVVGGGSPVATLWAVYELGRHFGLRYLLTGDVPPAKRPALKLDGIDIKLEPALRLRTWRTLNDFAIGPEAWGLADQKRLLRQVAKLKFNRVLLSAYPWQPFVDYEFRGVKKQTAMLWYGYRYPIDAETPGRAAFKGVAEFTSPGFSGKQA